MPNVKSIINKHNKTVLDPPTNTTEKNQQLHKWRKMSAPGKVLNQQHV